MLGPRAGHASLADAKAAGERAAPLARTGGVPTPVAALTFLGILIVVLGLFVAGNLAVVIVGLSAICSAGVLEVFGGRGVC